MRVKSVDGSALAGKDYNYVDQVVNFKAGERSKLIKVGIIDDDIAEPDEDFFLQLFDSTSNKKLNGLDTRLKITILDNDADANENFGFTQNHYKVGEGCGFVSIKVANKFGPMKKVRIVTVDGEARAGSDIEKADQVLDFSKGESYKNVRIKIIDDDTWEPDEDLFVRLLDAETGQNLIGHDTRTRVTIIDDDKHN